MKIKVLSKQDNPLFGRTEMNFEIEHVKEKTPSRLDAVNLVATSTKAKADLISISYIKSLFGQGKSVGVAHIYKKIESLKKHEPSYIQKRSEKAKEKSSKSEAKPTESNTPEPKPTESVEKEKPVNVEAKSE